MIETRKARSTPRSGVSMLNSSFSIIRGLVFEDVGGSNHSPTGATGSRWLPTTRRTSRGPRSSVRQLGAGLRNRRAVAMPTAGWGGTTSSRSSGPSGTPGASRSTTSPRPLPRLAKPFENTTTSASGWLQVACMATTLRPLSRNEPARVLSRTQPDHPPSRTARHAADEGVPSCIGCQAANLSMASARSSPVMPSWMSFRHAASWGSAC